MLHKLNSGNRARRLLAPTILLTCLITSVTLATYSNRAIRSATAQQNSIVTPTERPSAKSNGKIAFVSNRDKVERIYTINADGSGLARLTDGPHQLQPAWSPDGTKLAFMDTLKGVTALYLMNADGSSPRLLASNIFHDVNLAWSPDGTKIAFCSVTPKPVSGSRFTLRVINADGSNEVRLASGSGAPTWSPDGKQIAFTTFQGIDLINVDGSNQRQLVKLNSWFPKSLAWSPDGKEMMFGSSRSSADQYGNTRARFTIEVISAEGNVGNDARLLGYGRSASWSPDGSKIVFVRTGTGVPSTQIWVMCKDGTNETQLTDIGTNWSPSWQPLLAANPN